MPLYLIVIIISFFASLIGLSAKVNRVPPLIFFPFFLLMTCVVEFLGDKLSLKDINTNLLYNFFSLFEFIFYLTFFWWLFKSAVIKKSVIAVMIFYTVITLLNIFFYQGKTGFHTYTYMLGCVIVVIFSVLYFSSLFRFPETGKLVHNPYFWIVTGVMFFDVCTFTFYGLNNFIAHTMRQYSWFLQFVSDILNILLYLSLTIGFLCRLRIRKLSGSL